jgi:hypothetical protein
MCIIKKKKKKKKEKPTKTNGMNMEMEQNESKYFTTAITQKQSRSTYKPTRNIFYRGEKKRCIPLTCSLGFTTDRYNSKAGTHNHAYNMN